MGKLCIGILAHVDAGKTTLAENILYRQGSIRTMGRVDHRDTFLDTHALERARGITIFSKQAQFPLGANEVTLVDTPGHVDFSAEMERTLQILDYAILVISGADGVQGHVLTLWRLLAHYQVPVFLFVNKMDQPASDHARLYGELKARLDGAIEDFTAERDILLENLATQDEELLEQYLETGTLCVEDVARKISRRALFPCFFGSALKDEGVGFFLEALSALVLCPAYGETFAAQVFKVSRDKQGNRMAHVKVTGGSLKVKAVTSAGKVDQIRIYDGAGYQAVQEAKAGTVCCVLGLSDVLPGDGLGAQEAANKPLLSPVLRYRVLLPEGCDAHKMLEHLRQLEEEDPLLRIVWEEQTGEIHAQVMGEVQMEILQEEVRSRFGAEIAFGEGGIVYKETITDAVIGMGHFEPLRHYAEVHLLLEPGKPGSGLVLGTAVGEDALDRNWQRLILSSLQNQRHVGVLTGSEITDMRITLVAGRAHLKHTEGGDFRQAACRAVRQGLMRAHCVLLEPFYDFRLEVPSAYLGRAMSDLTRMQAVFGEPKGEGEWLILEGTVPVASLGNYQRDLAAYTHGSGRVDCTFRGYGPCHNADEVLGKKAYDPDRDADHPSGSVFCAHGAGFYVPWDQVQNYMHVQSRLPVQNGFPAQSGFSVQSGFPAQSGFSVQSDFPAQGGTPVQSELPTQSGFPVQSASPMQSGLAPKSQGEGMRPSPERKGQTTAGSRNQDRAAALDRELEEIFCRTYKTGGGIGGKSLIGRETRPNDQTARPAPRQPETKSARSGQSASRHPKSEPARSAPKREGQPDAYLLVDGYNIIFAWEELRALAQTDLAAARDRLMDILCDYQGFRKCAVILVFDAYKVAGGVGSVQKYHNIDVVYTKEKETADQYIEKTAHTLKGDCQVTVATSDALEQTIIWGAGAARLSAAGLLEEVRAARRQMRADYLEQDVRVRQRLSEYLPPATCAGNEKG